MSGSFTRRDLLPLAAVGAAGLGIALMLRARVPVGRDVAGNAVAAAVLHDAAFPHEGPDDADIVMAVFTDVQCPACRRAAPELAAAVRADGRVRLIYRDWPIFGAVSDFAARVALAADRQGLYAAVHGLLMRGPRATAQTARQAVATAGGNLGQLDQALATHGAEMDAALARNAFHAFSLGLGGTPGHVIGRLLLRGAASEREFRRAFDRARALKG